MADSTIKCTYYTNICKSLEKKRTREALTHTKGRVFLLKTLSNGSLPFKWTMTLAGVKNLTLDLFRWRSNRAAPEMCHESHSWFPAALGSIHWQERSLHCLEILYGVGMMPWPMDGHSAVVRQKHVSNVLPFPRIRQGAVVCGPGGYRLRRCADPLSATQQCRY